MPFLFVPVFFPLVFLHCCLSHLLLLPKVVTLYLYQTSCASHLLLFTKPVVLPTFCCCPQVLQNLVLHYTNHSLQHTLLYCYMFVVALASLFKLVSSLCTQLVCVPKYVNRHFFIFRPLFVGTQLFFVFCTLSVGFYTLFHVHSVFAHNFHVAASTYTGLVLAIIQHLPSYSPKVCSSIVSSLAVTMEFASMIIYHYSFQLSGWSI